MKKTLSILLITLTLVILGTVVSFADYTSQFHLMEENISTLEAELAKHKAALLTDDLSSSELIEHDEQIAQIKSEIEIYKTSMATLENLSTPVVVETPVSTPATSNMKYVGDFKLTGYCPCRPCSEQWGTQTSSGRTATEGVTVATSKQFAFGTKLYIEGVGYRRVDDRGGAIKGNKIDVFVNSHSNCFVPAYNSTAKVYIVE